jgi:hypothetical protein
MIDLAEALAAKFDVSFLGNKETLEILNQRLAVGAGNPNITCIVHDGFDDYFNRLKENAHHFKAIVLGAVVNDLIPVVTSPFRISTDNIKAGTVYPIDFKVAPKVIDEICTVAPQTLVFGVRNRSGDMVESQVHETYRIIQRSGAAGMIVNDPASPSSTYFVLKDRSVHKFDANMLGEMIEDEYYTTRLSPGENPENIKEYSDAVAVLNEMAQRFNDQFYAIPEGLFVFGVIATRVGGGFLTTARGKRKVEDYTMVQHVNHETRTVYASPKKATLLAPFLDHLFKLFPHVKHILFTQENLDVGFPYAPAGTVRGSLRKLGKLKVGSDMSISFEVKGMGSFRLFTSL